MKYQKGFTRGSILGIFLSCAILTGIIALGLYGIFNLFYG